MQNRIRRAFNCMRERTCVSYAKIATMGGLCDVVLVITKATSPDDLPLPEKYVHHLLKIFSISPATASDFTAAFGRRFRHTRSWRVALKCLLLLHRLLRSSATLRAELLSARTNGILCLHPCAFSDRTSAASHHYTAFIRSYARLLDEMLDYNEEEDGQSADDGNTRCKPQELARMIEIVQLLPQLQSLIDRAIDCWPTGEASRSFLVHSAMKHVIRDCNCWYAASRREIQAAVDNLIHLPHRSSVAAFEVYKAAAAQADRLAGFYEWCKNMGYCGSYEYPYIDRISDARIRAAEALLDDMWRMTDDSESPESCAGGDGGGGEAVEDERGVEVEALIKWEDEEESGGGWEDLLEASIKSNAWKIEVYNPYGFQTPNPFYQQTSYIMNYGSCPNTPLACAPTYA